MDFLWILLGMRWPGCCAGFVMAKFCWTANCESPGRLAACRHLAAMERMLDVSHAEFVQAHCHGDLLLALDIVAPVK